MELFCLLDVHILNGRTTGDINGEITFTANEGCSIVDYNIASFDLFKHVERFSVENMDYSLHFPLSCTLLFKLAVVSPNTDKNSQKVYDMPWIRYKWTEEKSTIFYDKFVDLRFKCIFKMKRSLYEANQRRMLINAKHSPGSFGKIVKHDKSSVSNNNSVEISAYEWYNYFKTLFSDKLIEPVYVLNSEEFDEEKLEAANSLNNTFHEEEKVSSIRSLKTGKSLGPDGLTSEFSKFSCTEIAPNLSDIFNSGEFPASWGESIIRGVFSN